MLNILDRFVAREVLKGFVAVVGILLLILMSNQFVRYLARATEGEIAGDTVLTLLAAATLGYLGLLFAPALFFSIVLTLGRMSRDHETAALRACGVGPLRLYRGVFVVALPVSLCTAGLTLVLMPWAEGRVSQLKLQQEYSTAFSLLVSGRFNEFRDGRVIFYVQRVDHTAQTLHNVFVQSEEEIVAARSGFEQIDPSSGSRYLVLLNGTRYIGAAGTADFRVADFQRYGLLLDEKEQANVAHDFAVLATAELQRSALPAAVAELQWRYAVPLSVCVLSLLAVPLSRSQPRQGRYAKLVVALLVYLIYSNLLTVAKSLVERQEVDPLMGFWWVHALMVIAAIGLALREGRLGRRPNLKESKG